MEYTCIKVVTITEGNLPPRIVVELKSGNIKIEIEINEDFEKVPEDLLKLKPGETYSLLIN